MNINFKMSSRASTSFLNKLLFVQSKVLEKP